MTDAILDTNIVIAILKNDPKAINWQRNQGRRVLGITPVVWMETVVGTRDKSERARIVRFLHRFRMEHPTPDDNNWAMLQFAQYYLSHGIEYADIMIASVAVRLSVPLYTLNLRHYAPLPNVDERQPY